MVRFPGGLQRDSIRWNALLGLGLLALIVTLVVTNAPLAYVMIVLLSFLIGVLIIVSRIGGARHAGRGRPLGMLNSYSAGSCLRHRLHVAGKQPGDYHRLAGRLVGRDPQLYHVQRDELLHFISVISGRFRR